MERKLKGFTIIELMVVIAIIAVLASIGVPAALTWIRDAKIRDANEEARLVYSVVQDRLTELEIKNIAIDSDTCVQSVSDSGVTASTVPAGSESVYGMFDNSMKVYKFSDGLGSEFDGVWYVKINNETYTVEHAWWVAIPEGGTITLDGASVISTPYASLSEQETALKGSSVIIGQFPI